MRNMTPRPAARAVPFAAAVLTAILGQGAIYMFVTGEIGLPAACASMLVFAAIVVASLVLAPGRARARARAPHG